VSPRPLALVAALTGGDFLLWNWSLGANHTVPALIAGLTLPPLVAACALLFVLTAARLSSRIRPPAIRASPRHRAARARTAAARSALRHQTPDPPATQTVRTARARDRRAAPEHDGAPATAAEGRPGRSARKLAA
jgi:hypothetical protein